jgi:hypothetical protein
MESILAPTFGVMVFQEQVMQVARTIAGYTAPDADKLRKIMGKKLPEEMKKEKGKFVDGCMADFYEVEFENGNKITLRSDKKYEVEEGGFFSLEEIEGNNFSVCFPIKTL